MPHTFTSFGCWYLKKPDSRKKYLFLHLSIPETCNLSINQVLIYNYTSTNFLLCELSNLDNYAYDFRDCQPQITAILGR